jgi:hypothetical protein
MRPEPIIDARCASTLRNVNAFIDGELSAASAAILSKHLSECPSCQQEVEIRKNMSSRLKSAVSTAQPSPFLAPRIMAQVRAEERKPRWLQRSVWAGATAALLVVLVAGVAYKLDDVRVAVSSQDAYISRLVQKVSAVMRPGLSDHVHCSVYRKYRAEAPPVETLHQQIGPEYKDLVTAVSTRVPAGFKVYIAHQCGYNGRKFVHVGLHNGSQQISVVLAKREPGESFRDSGLLPVISSGGLNVYGASAERFQIAGLGTDTHLAYVVSEMSDRQTRELMLALAPTIQNTINNLKA